MRRESEIMEIFHPSLSLRLLQLQLPASRFATRWQHSPLSQSS